MATLNKVMLLGNVTRTPELRHTGTGTPVTGVGMALNERTSDGHGGHKERTTFVEVTFWDKAAEIICKYVQKGDLFYAEGSLQIRDRIINAGKDDERKETKLGITGTGFQLMPNNRRDNNDDRPARPATTGGKASPAPTPGSDGDDLSW